MSTHSLAKKFPYCPQAYPSALRTTSCHLREVSDRPAHLIEKLAGILVNLGHHLPGEPGLEKQYVCIRALTTVLLFTRPPSTVRRRASWEPTPSRSSPREVSAVHFHPLRVECGGISHSGHSGAFQGGWWISAALQTAIDHLHRIVEAITIRRAGTSSGSRRRASGRRRTLRPVTLMG